MLSDDRHSDYLVIGGGIVGLSTAMQLARAYPDATVRVLEKEDRLAAHQSGHNSGVIHAGVYYAPGSLKAKFCRAGVDATIAFCTRHQISFEQCGKLLVATTPIELERMDALEERCRANGLDPERLSAEQLKEREPNITGLGALFVRVTGIVDYPAMARALAKELQDAGGDVVLNSTVTGIAEGPDTVSVATSTGLYEARQLVVCGGLQADRLAKMAGVDVDFQIVPFRGEYYRLNARHNAIIKHLIYPIPDPDLPFLGVHLTRMIDGSVTVGPNAVLGFAREGYPKGSFDAGDVLSMLGFSGFWKVMGKNLRSGITEFRNSLSKQRYLKLCQKYAPGLTLDDLEPYPAGIRAQAVMADGTLVHDFLIKQTQRTLHVCNAPSPAATSSLPIGEHLVSLLAERSG
ncbi:L-2-hydroxyglutarate oxidase [Ahrensia marina]|uniref:L-2-hydroxyglutarate oxidase n=1 Tax=Ahrensia marina TaxID=1514904 RepID=UPI0035CE8B86